MRTLPAGIRPFRHFVRRDLDHVVVPTCGIVDARVPPDVAASAGSHATAHISIDRDALDRKALAPSGEVEPDGHLTAIGIVYVVRDVDEIILGRWAATTFVTSGVAAWADGRLAED
jgi:hypothetical protein